MTFKNCVLTSDSSICFPDIKDKPSIKFTSDNFSTIVTSFPFMAGAPIILVLALLFLSSLLLKFWFLNKL